MKPIKWDNRDCQKDYDYLQRCPLYEYKTPVNSHADIVSLLKGGWPICPDCGRDMAPMGDENGH